MRALCDDQELQQEQFVVAHDAHDEADHEGFDLEFVEFDDQ